MSKCVTIKKLMSYLYLYTNSVIHKDQPSGIRWWVYW